MFLNKSWALMALIAIPLSPADWKNLKYSNIKPNKIAESSEGLSIEVDKSNSPIVHPLPGMPKVSSFKIKLEVTGKKLPAPLTSNGWDDDAILRIGFVAEGKNKPNAALLFFSPGWIKELYKLAPEGKGIDQIYFYNLGRKGQRPGQQRIFPQTRDLVREEIVEIYEPNTKSYEIEHTFKEPKNIAGIWISADGDSTESQFKVIIKSFVLRP